MTFWIFFIILLFLILIASSLVVRRRNRLYESRRLKEVLSEEMQLVLRNERTENLQKKHHFEKLLKDADKPNRVEPLKQQQD